MVGFPPARAAASYGSDREEALSGGTLSIMLLEMATSRKPYVVTGSPDRG